MGGTSAMSFPAPDYVIDCLAAGEDPRIWATSLLYRALGEPNLPSKSRAECHTPGVDSVVLYDGPDGMIRFYLAYAGSNNLHQLVGPDGNFTVGIHNHRYRIAKIPLNQPINNITTSPVAWDYGVGCYLYEYEFRSALKGEGMEAILVGQRRMRLPQPDLILPGEVVIMEPCELHTVGVPRTKDAAWLVVEGRPQEITPLLYSPRADLHETLTDEGLYKPMNDAVVRASIAYVLGLM